MDRVPTEDAEEEAFCQYCDLLGLVHWHVPNETYTTSWKQKMKNRKLGVESGVSDHWVRIRISDEELLFVFEMKRIKGNTPSDKQITFIRNMNLMNDVYACCCYGAAEAITVLEEAKEGRYSTYKKLLERMEKIAKNREKKRKNEKIKEKNVCPF